MVATVKVKQGYGGSDGSPLEQPGAGLDADLRFHTADQYAPTDDTKPVPIPESGNKYSYWVHIYLDIEGGTFTKINNIRHYCDGDLSGWSLGTGGEVRRGNRDSGAHGAPMDASYEVGTGTEGDTGDEIEHATNGHTYYNGQTTKTADLENDIEASPADCDLTDHTVAEKCNAMVLQVKVGVGATRGTKAEETFTFKYDEI